MNLKNSISGVSLIVLVAVIGSGCASGRSATKKKEQKPTAQTTQTETVTKQVYFDFDKSDIRDDFKEILEDIASKLKGDEKAVTIIEGHADPIGGSEYNEMLAEDRARAIRVYLRDLGVDPHRVTITSKGERELVVQGFGRDTLAPNRRVEVIFTMTKQEEAK